MTSLLEDLLRQDPQFPDALLKPLLTYLLTAREVAGGDLDLNIILLVVAIRTIEHPDFRAMSDAERLEATPVFPTLGVNSRSIAESSGIPRETVRRKVADLVKRGWLARRGSNLHFTAKAFAALTPIRAAREQLAVDYYELIRAEALKLPAVQD
jgi:hypothetical protein